MKIGNNLEESIFLVVPFHDWRKIQMEGFRTRDSHFIEELAKLPGPKIIVNRPTTHLEIYLKRKPGLIKGELLSKKGKFSLYKLDEELYLIDYISIDILGQIFRKFEWFIDRYGDNNFIEFIKQSIEFVGANENTCKILNQNIFAPRLIEKLQANKKVFDAWDNFMKFDVYSNIRDQVQGAYSSLAAYCDFWITNSTDNVQYFMESFNPRGLHLVKNGVDVNRFTARNFEEPSDIKNIPRPIVGFGGKITHLLDVDLINATMDKAKNSSFVFVGQILSKEIFDSINKVDNFYYLGDKHYDEYPNYVNSFDICMVPYIVEDSKKSGANTIKVYEYLATGKKVVGTPSNGLEELSEHVYLVNSPNEFVQELEDESNNRKPIDLNEHSWAHKTETLLNLLELNGR
ncbi:glycosyltransferase [Flagellimonas amoyensis]|uniref:glycosyltransferase n=1 Tax=Flagellimonas amoyensis TaxID=2169401 RepID=UPI000D361FDA|nr:glycosyltransferase [Allomuricauda amoyensis]